MTPQLTLIMLSGLPGSGKSTYAAQLRVNREDIAYLHPDTLREQLTGDMSDQSRNADIFTSILPSMMRKAAAEGRDILLDGTFTTHKARRPFVELAKELGYRIECHVLGTNYEECCRRNAARARVVPDFVLTRMRDQFQSPSLDEGIDEIVHVQS